MPIETDADRLAFLDADEFGAEGVYTPAGGIASELFPGIFDRPTIATALNDAASLDVRPTFLCRQADLPAAADGDAGDQLAVAGIGTFEVTSIEPDGQGMALLRLEARV
ncbi:hypothetical protein [Bradyrhizobium sp. BRP23]|uniref:head-tail joining protein n=1 Tax=Bradyrhizobium sp. BRP23 TaxID=2793820 RepID=UPI001CD3C139|nr:hypothetical protein [Bradyrhizobium sp. BRP23]MCA1381296.1 hypothetical protein [Bradyrhizobium sp. BRP05]MCA1418584.1 hypothetical protein [Bradyrhizobium sp. BRP23]